MTDSEADEQPEQQADRPYLAFLHQTHHGLPLYAWLALAVYIVCWVTLAVWGYYLLNGLTMLVAFLVLYPYLGGLAGVRGWLTARSLGQQMVLLFVVALLLRFALLFQGQVITLDIVFYVDRSEALVAGDAPYVERADINKPPLFALYIWFVGAATSGINSSLLGGSDLYLSYHVAFRFVSSVADSLVVILLFWVLSARYSRLHALQAGLAYALFPIAVESSGLSGHYDPFVILTTLLALHFVWPVNPPSDSEGAGQQAMEEEAKGPEAASSSEVAEGEEAQEAHVSEVGEAEQEGSDTKEEEARDPNVASSSEVPQSGSSITHAPASPWYGPPLAGFILGLGIALKFYPVVMAPFLLFVIKGWRDRLGFAFSLPVATLLSFGVLEWRYPGATQVYMDYQGGDWMEVWLKSFARAFQELGGVRELLGVSVSDIFLVIFGLLGLLMVMGWLMARSLSTGWGGNGNAKGAQRTIGGGGRKPRACGAATAEASLAGQGNGSSPWPQFLLSIWQWKLDLWKRMTARYPGWRTEHGWTLLAYQFIVVTFLVYYGFQVASGYYIFEDSLHSSPPWVFALTWLIAYFALFVWLVPRYLPRYTPHRLSPGSAEPLLLLSAFAIMVLLFGSPDYPTWYICWFAPLVMAAPNPVIRRVLLILMVWNTPGEGLQLAPGLITGEGVT